MLGSVGCDLFWSMTSCGIVVRPYTYKTNVKYVQNCCTFMCCTMISVSPSIDAYMRCISKTTALICMLWYTVGKGFTRSKLRQSYFVHKGAMSPRWVHPTAIAVRLVWYFGIYEAGAQIGSLVDSLIIQCLLWYSP